MQTESLLQASALHRLVAQHKSFICNEEDQQSFVHFKQELRAESPSGSHILVLCEQCCRFLRESIQQQQQQQQRQQLERCERRADEIAEFCWERLHAGYWRDVSIVWRNTYSFAIWTRSIAKLVRLLPPAPETNSSSRSNNNSSGESLFQEESGTIAMLKAIIKDLDMALMMGGHRFRENVQDLVEGLHNFCIQTLEQQQQQQQPAIAKPKAHERSPAIEDEDQGEAPTKRARSSKKGEEAEETEESPPQPSPRAAPPLPMKGPRQEIPRIEAPSLEAFMRDYFIPRRPVIIMGAIQHWPCVSEQMPERNWSNFRYLKRVAGMRTVPVEVGKDYLAEEWSQKLMTLSEFIDNYIIADESFGEPPSPQQQQQQQQRQPQQQQHTKRKNKKKGYLAQHQLFDQIRQLELDFETPLYCYSGKGDLVSVNGWFGPGGTVSPLHTDPYNNVLCQVVGSKRIVLYDPKCQSRVYPQTGLLSNTSQVDIEDESCYERFPLFSETPYWCCTLMKGEMLYIPPLWWHHVRSLETSFSISFWWE